MATNFSSLRNSRKDLISKLAAEVKKSANPTKGGVDDRFWKLSTDAKTGIGFARLRFLPAAKNEDLPYVRVFSHGFQGPAGQWFIENCPTSMENRQCPVCKENNKLWNSGIEADKKIVRDRKRKLSYISNVLILEDPAHPENEGKVFLYKYGKRIFDKINELLEPQFPDQKPANPFDFWEGCDFKLKSQKKDGYQNYDKSEFVPSSELFPGDDTKKEHVWEQQHPLNAFGSEDQFKSYDELAKRFARTISGEDNDRPETADEILKRESALPTPAFAPPLKSVPERRSAVVSDPDEDEVTKFFADVLED